LKFVLLRIRQALAVGVVGLAPALTGCLTHIRTVPKTRPAEVVRDATLDQLLTQVDNRFNQTQTLRASVEIVATEGGARQGQIKVHPALSGYIFLRKPEELRVLLLVPVLGSQALDMVSDGKTWKLWIPPEHKAMAGTNDVAETTQHGLESLRPKVIFDSLVVRGVAPDQLVDLTQDSRIIPDDKDKKQLIEEPDYELTILEQPHGQIAHTLRVIHIGRSTMKIEIKRPQDQYGLTITVTKLAVNQKLDDDQFDLKFPEGVTPKTMN
jgi:outer membrane lipoprotein-sorting protein